MGQVLELLAQRFQQVDEDSLAPVVVVVLQFGRRARLRVADQTLHLFLDEGRWSFFLSIPVAPNAPRQGVSVLLLCLLFLSFDQLDLFAGVTTVTVGYLEEDVGQFHHESVHLVEEVVAGTAQVLEKVLADPLAAAVGQRLGPQQPLSDFHRSQEHL